MTQTEASAIAYLESRGVIPSASPVFSLGGRNSATGTKFFLERLFSPPKPSVFDLVPSVKRNRVGIFSHAHKSP